jgi:hypothetical protein
MQFAAFHRLPSILHLLVVSGILFSQESCRRSFNDIIDLILLGSIAYLDVPDKSSSYTELQRIIIANDKSGVVQ